MSSSRIASKAGASARVVVANGALVVTTLLCGTAVVLTQAFVVQPSIQHRAAAFLGVPLQRDTAPRRHHLQKGLEGIVVRYVPISTCYSGLSCYLIFSHVHHRSSPLRSPIG